MRKILSILWLALIIIACEEIISVVDISSDSVEILSPRENTTIATGKVNLNWRPIDFASEYEIQISSPSFMYPQKIVLDTTVFDTLQSFIYQVNTTLVPGNYEWRIRAINSDYNTAFSSQSFRVAEDNSLEGNIVRLDIPENDAIITDTDAEVFFKWEEIEAATLYRIRIRTAGSNQNLVEQSTTVVEFNYEFEDSGNYEWEVRAENETENTLFTTRSFEIILN